MRIAHVRERTAPAGSPWRLAAALNAGDEPARWLDLEVARRRAVRADPRLEHNAALFRQPISTLDAHLALGLRVEALGELLEGFEPGDDDDPASLDGGDLRFGPPILRPPSLRDFYAFERHVATIWARRDSPVPEAWYRLPIFYFSNVSEIRGPGDPVWRPAASQELDYELEVCVLVDTPALDLAPDRAEEAIGGYMIMNDWSARDLQREETAVRLGPAKGKDFATSIGPWLVTPDELEQAAEGRPGVYHLAMAARLNGVERSRGDMAELHYSFGEMIARASAGAELFPGDVVASGTVGTGCLLELTGGQGPWLQPGDVVELEVERLGVLKNTVVSSQR